MSSTNLCEAMPDYFWDGVSFELDSELECLGGKAFAGSSIESIVIPRHVKKIEVIKSPEQSKFLAIHPFR